MADIRFKDLTTTASSTASDDFIAVDGTTNGTRKLSAFSPTFGGNATVTGTLTSGGLGVGGAANIGGTLTIANTSAELVLGVNSGSALSYIIRPAQAGGAIEILQNSASVNRWISLGGVSNTLGYTESLRIANGGHVAVINATASTSTSTGALVVSGGVGVAKTINVAEGITIGTSSIYGVNVKLNSQSGEEKTFLFQSVGVNRWGFGVEASLEFGSNSGSDFHLVSYSDAGVIIDVPIRLVRSAGGAFTLSRPAVFSSSTASTSIATGALKITGGLGVGGAVNAGTFYGLVDGVTAPATESGYARIYVDSADGDLKVKFGDGTVKTIATDS
jgi:hypothetical protein